MGGNRMLSAVYVIVILIFNSIENIIKENKIMVIDDSMSTPLENRGSLSEFQVVDS